MDFVVERAERNLKASESTGQRSTSSIPTMLSSFIYFCMISMVMEANFLMYTFCT
jgi:hypothetical protein